MAQRSHEEDSIHSIEEDLEKMTLAHSLAAQQQKNGDDLKTPLDSKSVLRNSENRKATKDDPKDNASTTVLHSRLRPDLEHSISSTTSDETFSPLPPVVWVITQTRIVPTSTLRTLCLCTTLFTTKLVLSYLQEELASRPFLYVPEGTKGGFKKYRVSQRHRDGEPYEDDIGFEVLMDETEGLFYHVKARREGGIHWQGKIADGKVFGEGFTEVTQEDIRRVLRGWK